MDHFLKKLKYVNCNFNYNILIEVKIVHHLKKNINNTPLATPLTIRNEQHKLICLITSTMMMMIKKFAALPPVFFFWAKSLRWAKVRVRVFLCECAFFDVQFCWIITYD